MNEDATNRAFVSIWPAMQGCVEAGSRNNKAFGGSVTIALRVGRDGAAKWAYAKSTTLGDRDTEKCLLDVVRAKEWPRPVGGEGLAEKSIDLAPLTEPLPVSEELSKRPIALVRKEAAKCRKGVRGTFTVTAYIRTSGRVLAVGIAPPSEQGEEAADCLAEIIRKVRFVPAGNRIGKLSFELH